MRFSHLCWKAPGRTESFKPDRSTACICLESLNVRKTIMFVLVASKLLLNSNDEAEYVRCCFECIR